MENNLSDNRAEKVTASSKHRWAEHGGALVLCGRAGNSACKKLLGACANTTAFFFFQRKEDGSQGHSQRQNSGRRGWQQPYFGLLAAFCQAGHFCCTLNVKYSWHRAELSQHMLCVIRRKAEWKQLTPQCFPPPLPSSQTLQNGNCMTECIHHNSLHHYMAVTVRQAGF